MPVPSQLAANHVFTFTHRRIDGRVIRLGYRIEGGGSPLDLEERMVLPPGLPGDPESPSVARALEGLHLACGTSYWKTSCAPNIRIDAGLAPEDAAFWTEVWTHGLGEFFFANGLSPRGRVTFPADPTRRIEAVDARSAPEHAPPLLLVGGGKDSVVSAEILKSGGRPPLLFALGNAEWIRRASRTIGGELLVMERHLAPGLFELNARGALNGHVPISAIISFAARIVALLADSPAVIASNERSASVGNAVIDGFEVNHQWSKGIAFERLLAAWEARHLPHGPRYFSLLRPLSELRIGQLLSRAPQHFDSITSCNRNFRIQPRAPLARPGAPSALPTPRWCGTCPKCVFVYLVVAPWLDEAGIQRLFGARLLDDPATLPVVEELAGLARQKPFECVGTPDEVIAALVLLDRQGRHADTAALRLFRERIAPGLSDPDRLVEETLQPSPEHLIPAPYEELLNAALRAH